MSREDDTDVRAKSDRPLDCWKEVEAFKNEVNKLEQVSWQSFSGQELMIGFRQVNAIENERNGAERARFRPCMDGSEFDLKPDYGKSGTLLMILWALPRKIGWRSTICNP